MNKLKLNTKEKNPPPLTLTQQTAEIRREIIDKMLTLATSAFGLVAALAWNDAVKEIFNRLFGEQQQLSAKVIYALSVTALVVLVTYLLSRWSGKSDKQQSMKK